MKVGSEIMPLTTDFLRMPGKVGLPSTGVTRPDVGGCGSDPTGDGRADPTVGEGPFSPGDIPD